MMTLEALVMVLFAAVAVFIAYTKLQCHGEDPRISWLPELPEEAGRERAGTGRF